MPRGSLTPKVGVYSYVPEIDASAFNWILVSGVPS